MFPRCLSPRSQRNSAACCNPPSHKCSPPSAVSSLAESPSLDKLAADRCCAVIAAEWRKCGLAVERIAQKHRGDHLRIVAPSRAKSQLLVLGHYDTVYATGTLKKMPFRVSAGKAFGPGVFDMKAGIVQALFAYSALKKLNALPEKRIVFLWVSDEEIGSPSSRKLIETEARRSDAVFRPRTVLRPARPAENRAQSRR